MRLQQFLSSVFPRILKTKAERNRQRNSADQRAAVVQQISNDSLLELTDLKHAFDTVDLDSSAPRVVSANIDRSRSHSIRGGEEDELDWVSEDSRIGAVVSRSRSMIRTNPWLSSPKSTHNDTTMGESQIGPLLPKSLPSTPTTCLFGKTTEYRHALARRELGILLLQVPGNVDDSASEGYASSVFRSPSVTDLDSFGGGLDSALASSVSSESDSEWESSVTHSHSLVHASSTPSYQIVGSDRKTKREGIYKERVIVAPLKTSDHGIETANTASEELIHSKKIYQGEGVSIEKDQEEPENEEISIDSRTPNKHPNDLKLMKCYSQSEFPSVDLIELRSSRSQCESQSTFERIKQATEDSRPPISNDNTATRGDTEEETENDKKTELEKMDGGADDKSVSSRSLGEISESLQDKVRRLHEQKLYVDAIFHRAREEDMQRESQFAKFRSQFVAAKKQALLRKLQQLQTMLGNQSARLQVVYDAVLLVQWPKVFTVNEVK